jgi:putative membrane protein
MNAALQPQTVILRVVKALKAERISFLRKWQQQPPFTDISSILERFKFTSPLHAGIFFMKENTMRFPHWLLVVYTVLFVALGINPSFRDVWIAENFPIVIIMILQVYFYWKGVRFSNLAYAMMFALVVINTIGGHYTFEKVPFDWFNNFFGFKRNMYDRVGHFSVGLYAFAIVEFLEQRQLTKHKFLSYSYAFFTIAFVAMAYEIIEWQYAEIAGGEAGAAFLGSQGDIWDAQKDMLLDMCGAVFALVLYALIIKKPRS